MKSLKIGYLFILAIVAQTGQLNAAVPVEERGVNRGQTPATSYPTERTTPVSNRPPEPVATDAYGTLQMLQQEVMELRGLIDELSHEVSELKQRQVDDYLDLDRRIGAASSSPLSGSPPPPQPGSIQPSTSPAPVASAPARSADDEVKSYSTAYNQLKEGNIDAAKQALNQHIVDFPDGDYTPNAYYWLGEIFLLENQLKSAIEAFEVVTTRYPVHRKAADARFKLGKSYHLLGNNQKARQYLEQAAEGTGSSASLAKQYLQDNF